MTPTSSPDALNRQIHRLWQTEPITSQRRQALFSELAAIDVAVERLTLRADLAGIDPGEVALYSNRLATLERKWSGT